MDTEYFTQDVEFRKILAQEKPFTTFLSAVIFGTVTVSKVILILATMFSAWVVLSLFNFELTNHLWHQQLHNGLTTNTDTHEANLKYRPVLQIILQLSSLLG